MDDVKMLAPKPTVQENDGVAVDKMFRAFTDTTRLRILHLLLRGEWCVGDLVKVLEVSQPRVSQHLSYLRQADMVSQRKSGLWRFYSLTPAKAPFQRKLHDLLRDCFAEVPELQQDDRRADKLDVEGRCCDMT